MSDCLCVLCSQGSIKEWKRLTGGSLYHIGMVIAQTGQRGLAADSKLHLRNESCGLGLCWPTWVLTWQLFVVCTKIPHCDQFLVDTDCVHFLAVLSAGLRADLRFADNVLQVPVLSWSTMSCDSPSELSPVNSSSASSVLFSSIIIVQTDPGWPACIIWLTYYPKVVVTHVLSV